MSPGLSFQLGGGLCSGLGIASLFVMARMKTDEFDTGISEYLDVRARNFFWAILSVAALAAVIAAVCLWTKKQITYKTARWTAALAALGVTAVCFVWMNSFSNAPMADQKTTWEIARQMAGLCSGDEGVHDYLRLYPFQASMAAVMKICISIFGDTYFSWQVLNALSAGACVYILSCICARVTGMPCAKCVCALLLLSFFPLAMYSTFIYGTLPGTALALFGLYAVIRECSGKTTAVRWWLGALAAFTAAIILYTGNKIFLLAAVIVIAVSGLVQKKGGRRVLAAAVLLLSVLLCGVWQKNAMHRMGMQNETGCPILPRILMGVDAYSDKDMPGFYNDLSVKVYRENNYDAVQTNRACVTHIRNSLAALHRQGRFLAFFAEKTADQWLDPWFGSMAMSSPAIYTDTRWIAQGLIDKTLLMPMQEWLSTLLSFVYIFGAGGAVYIACRNRKSIAMQVLTVCLIGGFLFQLASEAKSRYCLPYYLCCFPLAAAGIAALAEKLGQRAAVRKAGQK